MPTHVEVADDQVAIYYDGTGTGHIFAESDLVSGTADPLVLTAAAPHHGLAFPGVDRHLMTIPGDRTASGLTAYDNAGNPGATYADCPGLHGVAPAGDDLIVGCRDGLLRIAADGTSDKLAYPTADGQRVGTFAHPSEGAAHIVGHYGDSESSIVLVTDLTSGTSTQVDVGAAYRSMLDLGDGSAAVATIAGDVVLIDLASATVTDTIAAIPAWELPEGHGGLVALLAQSGHSILVSDPAGGVVAVERDSTTVTELPVHASVTSMVVTNADS